jgi:hypothetical protein
VGRAGRCHDRVDCFTIAIQSAPNCRVPPSLAVGASVVPCESDDATLRNNTTAQIN